MLSLNLKFELVQWYQLLRLLRLKEQLNLVVFEVGFVFSGSSYSVATDS